MKSIYILVGLQAKMVDVWNYIPSRISALLMSQVHGLSEGL